MEKHGCLVVLIALAVVLQTGSATKCYNCLSKEDARCVDPNAERAAGEAVLEPQECTPALLTEATNVLEKGLKAVSDSFSLDLNVKGSEITPDMVCQKLVTQVDNDVVIHRSCQLADVNVCDGMVKKFKNQNAVLTHCSTCNVDGCNGAPSSVRSAPLIGYLALTCLLGGLWARLSTA